MILREVPLFHVSHLGLVQHHIHDPRILEIRSGAILELGLRYEPLLEGAILIQNTTLGLTMQLPFGLLLQQALVL